MDESSQIQNRRASRSRVLLQATLETPGNSYGVVLRNISCQGALVEGGSLPEVGTQVLFHRQGLSVPSTVAWVEGRQAGLQFLSALFPNELLRHIPPAAGSKIVVAPPPKRPGLGSQPLTAGEQAFAAAWATDPARRLGD